MYLNTSTWNHCPSSCGRVWIPICLAPCCLCFEVIKGPKNTIEDHVNEMYKTKSLCSQFVSLAHILTQMVPCSRPLKPGSAGEMSKMPAVLHLLGLHLAQSRPSYAMPVNCITMQVFCDIAPVTVQLIDWCCSCSDGITGPVKSEIHQRCLHRSCFTAVWWSLNTEDLLRVYTEGKLVSDTLQIFPIFPLTKHVGI